MGDTYQIGSAGMGRPTTILLESDGSGSAGDAVTGNASGQVSQTSAADDGIVGFLQDDAPAAGEDAQVHIGGYIAVSAGASVSKFDVLDASGTTAGAVEPNAQGLSHQVSEGGTAAYRLSFANPIAYEAASSGESVLVKL